MNKIPEEHVPNSESQFPFAEWDQIKNSKDEIRDKTWDIILT